MLSSGSADAPVGIGMDGDARVSANGRHGGCEETLEEGESNAWPLLMLFAFDAHVTYAWSLDAGPLAF